MCYYLSQSTTIAIKLIRLLQLLQKRHSCCPTLLPGATIQSCSTSFDCVYSAVQVVDMRQGSLVVTPATSKPSKGV